MIKTTSILLTFVRDVCGAFNHVVYVAGNHEFYRSELNHVIKRLKEKISNIPNLHILYNETVTLDGQRFVGTPVFSNLTNDGYWNRQITERINDFRKISYRRFGRKLTAMDMKYLYATALLFLTTTIKADNVVITHWLPSPFCIDKQYKGDSFINYYYASTTLEELNVFPKAWVYSHTHIKNYSIVRYNDIILSCNLIGYYPGQAKYEITFEKFIDF